MSWDVTLIGEDGVCRVEWHEHGGTYALGGSSRATLNVAYNYGARFLEAWPEDVFASNVLSRMLHGRTAADTIPLLETAIARLGTDRSPDYWEATPGNAGFALSILLGWARQHPDAEWEVR